MRASDIDSLGGLIIHILRVAFFLDKQPRVSRGEYMFGMLLFLLLGLLIFFLFLCSIIFSPYQDHDWGLSFIDIVFTIGMVIAMVSILLILIATINLSVKRLHDLNKSGRWLWTLLIPIFNIYMIVILFAQQGDAEANRFGHNNVQNVYSNLSYFLLCGSMFILCLGFALVSFIFLTGLTLPEDGGMANQGNYTSSNTLLIE